MKNYRLGILLLLSLSITSCMPHATTLSVLSAAAYPTNLKADSITLPGVPNLSWVAPGLWRSGQPESNGFISLKNFGIKTIIDLAGNDYPLIKDLDFTYVPLPLSVCSITDADIHNFLAILDNPNNYPILVHCTYGVDRTGVMIANYRTMKSGWSKQRALNEMRAKGWHWYLYPWLSTKVKSWE